MQIEKKKVSDLKYAPYNPRKIDDKELAKLKRSISEFGYVEPIVWNKRSGFVVGGNQRLKALRELEIEEVDAVVVDLDDAKEKALNVALNKISGEWDFIKLKDVLTDIDTGDFDIELTGFDLDEIADLITFDKEPEEDDFDADAAIEEIEEPKTKRGDIYLLGKHRLMCGDSTVKEDVEKLMDGKKADMVFTDPPYGVNYDGGTKLRNKLAGDDTTDLYEPCCKMARDFSTNEAALYLWHAGVKGIAAAAAAAAADWVIRCEIVWNKNHAQFGALSAQYKQKHEPCYYCYKKGKTVNWCGPKNEVTVWDVDRALVNEYHPTQKPVELAKRAIQNHKADLVLDLFGGSGSTLIACEQLNRICYMIEIDERYCDVIVKRWEEYTGKKAQLMRK